MICPVINPDDSDNKKVVSSAISDASPILLKTWRSSEVFNFTSLFKSFSARGVLVIEGAIQFTLIVGANSASQ